MGDGVQETGQREELARGGAGVEGRREKEKGERQGNLRKHGDREKGRVEEGYGKFVRAAQTKRSRRRGDGEDGEMHRKRRAQRQIVIAMETEAAMRKDIGRQGASIGGWRCHATQDLFGAGRDRAKRATGNLDTRLMGG